MRFLIVEVIEHYLRWLESNCSRKLTSQSSNYERCIESRELDRMSDHLNSRPSTMFQASYFRALLLQQFALWFRGSLCILQVCIRGLLSRILDTAQTPEASPQGNWTLWRELWISVTLDECLRVACCMLEQFVAHKPLYNVLGTQDFIDISVELVLQRSLPPWLSYLWLTVPSVESRFYDSWYSWTWYIQL